MVDCDVHLEAEEPTHGRLAALCQPFKYLVAWNAFGVADLQGTAVDDVKPGFLALPHQHLQQQTKRRKQAAL